jgi:hypothetical protein
MNQTLMKTVAVYFGSLSKQSRFYFREFNNTNLS